MNSRHNKTFGRFLFKIFSVLLFCLVCAGALFFAYGYNFDLKHRNIEKTSIIDVSSRYPEAYVYLNDKLVANSLPVHMKELIPGAYNVVVHKAGYLTWRQLLRVEQDFVTRVVDAVLFPEHIDDFIHQLIHFPDGSTYFYGKNSFVVFNTGHAYITVVYFQNMGLMKEKQLKIPRQDIKDISVINDKKLMLTYDDGSFALVDVPSENFVNFVMPKGSTAPVFLPSQDSVYFLFDRHLYQATLDKLRNFTLDDFTATALLNSVDEFDVQDSGIFYISNGLAFRSDLDGKHIQLLDSSRTIQHFRFLPFAVSNGGFFIVRTSDQQRYLYVSHSNSTLTLLTSQLKGEVFQDNGGRAYFTDESGNVFLYKPLLKKKILVTTLTPDDILMGTIFDDGHFIFSHQGEIFVSDTLYSNVYSILPHQQNIHYFIQNKALFFLTDHVLKSVYWLPPN